MARLKHGFCGYILVSHCLCSNKPRLEIKRKFPHISHTCQIARNKGTIINRCIDAFDFVCICKLTPSRNLAYIGHAIFTLILLVGLLDRGEKKPCLLQPSCRVVRTFMHCRSILLTTWAQRWRGHIPNHPVGRRVGTPAPNREAQGSDPDRIRGRRRGPLLGGSRHRLGTSAFSR